MLPVSATCVITEVIIARPNSWFAISRPRKFTVTFVLLPSAKKFLDLPHLDFQIVLVGPRPQFDFFHLRRLLVPPALMFLLAELVLVLAIVHDPADGRLRGGGDLDQVIVPIPAPS